MRGAALTGVGKIGLVRLPGIRTRFQIRSPRSAEAALARIDAFVCGGESPVRGWAHPPYAELAVSDHDEHFWCPRLAIHVERVGESASVLDCRLQPAPSVWTMYMAGWGMLAVSSMLVFGFGWAQLRMDSTPTVWLVGLPTVGAVAAFLYVSALLGQRLGVNEARVLIEALHAALREEVP